MKKTAFCLLLLSAFLTACTAESKLPPQQNGLVFSDDVLKYYSNGLPVRFSPGIQMIEGKAYYVEADGVSLCSLKDALAEMNGQLLCFTEDSSLAQFEAGFVTVDGSRYYAPEDGYALCAARNQVLRIDDSFYAFDADCRLTELSEGVQEIYGNLYYVPEDGIAIAVAQEGPLPLDNGLYYANADGTLAADAEIGYLTFGHDGRYTSGSETLDAQVEDLLTQAEIIGVNPIEDFRLCYAYIRDHFRYLSMAHYPAGSTEWAQSGAETFFQNGKGNCYCWAAAQMYCARRLGIQAYVVAGWEDKITNDHAWMMAQIDGAEYLFDAELEYAQINIYHRQPVDMFMATQNGGTYNGYYYFFP